MHAIALAMTSEIAHRILKRRPYGKIIPMKVWQQVVNVVQRPQKDKARQMHLLSQILTKGYQTMALNQTMNQM